MNGALKKFICFIMCVILMIACVGCGQNATVSENVDNAGNSAEQVASTREMSLLYSSADSINPYLAKTNANREIAKLLYDSLVKIDNNFEAVFVLAESVNMQNTICTVRLRNARFTDGSSVTADDVVYSYNLAKESAEYKHNFYEIVSLEIADSKTLIFTLSQNDPYFANLLTFPILKSGTSGLTDSDGKEIPPTGCGRYKILFSEQVLQLNNDYFGNKSLVKTIRLINSPDAASTTHYVEVGAVGMYYTDSGDIVRMSAKKTEVNLNRFVYIGVNDQYGSLATKELRYAISSALDREAVCKSAYYDNAVSATGFFNPNFKPTKSLQTIESTPNLKITVENLSKIGYNNMNSNGFYANSAGNNPVFTLLVNSENTSRVAAANLIAEQCKTAGIQIKVVECTYEQYLERLSNGDFQLYLGEIQLLDNMDLAQLVLPGGTAAYGVNKKLQDETEENEENTSDLSNQPQEEQQAEVLQSPCEMIFESYYAGQCGISDIAGTLLTEMPQIPVCYLKGVLFYNSAIKSGVEASSNDIYFNFENYEF